MENVKVEYSSFYLEALRNLKAAHDALINREFQRAYEHCLDATTEMRLMSGAVKSWMPKEENA
jgi:hypothetical protein